MKFLVAGLVFLWACTVWIRSQVTHPYEWQWFLGITVAGVFMFLAGYEYGKLKGVNHGKQVDPDSFG